MQALPGVLGPYPLRISTTNIAFFGLTVLLHFITGLVESIWLMTMSRRQNGKETKPVKEEQKCSLTGQQETVILSEYWEHSTSFQWPWKVLNFWFYLSLLINKIIGGVYIKNWNWPHCNLPHFPAKEQDSVQLRI